MTTYDLLGSGGIVLQSGCCFLAAPAPVWDLPLGSWDVAPLGIWGVEEVRHRAPAP